MRALLVIGWVWFLLGVVSGACIGLFFHREGWLGGYGSHARRMVRLGHISFFGLGLLTVVSVLSVEACGGELPGWACAGWVVACATMPAACFLTAWRRGFRHMFPVPVLAATAGVVGTLASICGWRW